jgi:hypothetical protein
MKATASVGLRRKVVRIGRANQYDLQTAPRSSDQYLVLGGCWRGDPHFVVRRLPACTKASGRPAVARNMLV